MKMAQLFGGGGIRFADPPQRQQAAVGAGESQNEDVDGDESQQEDADDFGVFSEIFTEPEPDDDDDPDKNKTPPPAGQQQQQTPPQQTDQDKELAAEIQRMIGGIGVGEADIPADFDVNDPKQLRDLISKSQQKAAMTTMQATLKPIQLAMTSMMEEMRNEIRTMFNEGLGQDKRRQRLEEAIPEAKDPKFKEIVDVVYKNAMKNLKDESKALSATRKAIDAMGLPKSRERSVDPSQGGSLRGRDALNLYAPMPQRK